jgi:hypothetical protein
VSGFLEGLRSVLGVETSSRSRVENARRGASRDSGRVTVSPAAKRPVGSLRHRVHRIFCDHGEGKAEGPINADLALYVRIFHEIAERWHLRA